MYYDKRDQVKLIYKQRQKYHQLFYTLQFYFLINPLKSAPFTQNSEFLLNKAVLCVQMGSTTFVECFPFRLFM